MSSEINVNSLEDEVIRPVSHQIMTLQVTRALHFTVPNVIISKLVRNDALHPNDMLLYSR